VRIALTTALTLLLAATAARGQTPAERSFRILERGMPIGDARVTVKRAEPGWTLTGSSTLGGSIGLDVRRFELVYDAAWRGRSFSLELARPDRTVIAHAIVAVPGARTRTDIVLEREVRPAFNHVSPHAVLLPDYVLPAFVALPPRLAGSAPGHQIPAFVPLRTEFTLVVEGVKPAPLTSASGPVAARHWSLRIEEAVPVAIELWEQDGELLRVDLPEGLSMVRDGIG
jgi:hypothetical protein